MVPFDASKTPVQIANLGTGGGVGGDNKCYKQFCPCNEIPNCENKCQAGNPIIVDGRWSATCVPKEGSGCTEGCLAKWCEVQCPEGTIINSTFSGPCYMVKANTLVFNGTTY